MKPKLLTILAMVLFLSACDKEANEDAVLPAVPQNKNVAHQQLTPHPTVGTWNWLQSTGGFIGGTETPASTGNSVVLKITDNRYKVFTNGISTQSNNYVFTMHESIFGGTREMFTFTYTFDDLVFYEYKSYNFIDNDTLVIHDEVFDGLNAYYVRQ